MNALARPRSIALIESRYCDVVAFAGAETGASLSDGAVAAAAVCLGLNGSPVERLEQLRFAGALVACEMDRLLALLGSEARL